MAIIQTLQQQPLLYQMSIDPTAKEMLLPGDLGAIDRSDLTESSRHTDT
jgi:hypothetical protein